MQPEVRGRFLVTLNIVQIPILDKYSDGKLKRTLKKELKDCEPGMAEACSIPVQGYRGLWDAYTINLLV